MVPGAEYLPPARSLAEAPTIGARAVIGREVDLSRSPRPPHADRPHVTAGCYVPHRIVGGVVISGVGVLGLMVARVLGGRGDGGMGGRGAKKGE